MRTFRQRYSIISSLLFWVGGLGALIALATALISCSGTPAPFAASGTGTVSVSMTDPPSCAFPNGSFQHVYVSIRSVQAHTSATADDSTPGWQELAPQLNKLPLQIDLFAAGNACLLTELGSNTALPTGTYQQIRLLLVANDGGGGPVPASNACGSQGYNCVVLHDGSVHELLLSSQANTGLKIPPGQVVGGPITVANGQDVDLDIDFNACASIIQQGNGEFRLKPVLTAGQVDTTTTGISGQVVDSKTLAPIVGGTVLVALEEQDSTGKDVIFRQEAADANGNFSFCPLPPGASFEVVAVGINAAGVAYNATVAVGVLGGSNLGVVPLTAETGTTAGPTTFQGFVTATMGSTAATIDASVSTLQTISLGGGATRSITIPAEGASIGDVSVESNTTCPISAPLHSNCAQYTLIEPASNPSVGIFASGKVSSYIAPPSGNVLYSITASAAKPMSGGISDCMPSSLTTSVDSGMNPLKAVAGATVTPSEFDFAGCS
jgi:hypothetical protein